ncbi:ejaculatory bulb-specific protein 3-like isoform X1 [Schistocerca serialis cubense]|uniref:ejaculatory bulb-specific protein 3-like isoform X1 n=1 Tax=Schistocerca serialis cubense TaxID=2023355 RepID=UPI00214E8EF2|nr:ejaculatory bulb-specific protein 3-like isoform X1 [Schistocerca serialis cubense]
MKSALALVAVLAVMALTAADDEKYTTKYDNIDLDEILANDRLMHQYELCLTEEDDSSCTPEGKELKKDIPDALETECAKCNDKQKEAIRKVIKFLINKKPETWENLKEHYDKDGKYSEKYKKLEDELKE